MNIARIRHYAALTTGRVLPANDSQRRYIRIVQATITALFGKGITLFVSFISVPLTVGYLGAERYGVWMTISTLLAWLVVADFGLSNSLTNALSEAYGKERPDLAQTYVSTAFWLLVIVAISFGGIFTVLWFFVDWAALFNVNSTQAKIEVAPTVAAAFAIFFLNFPLSIVVKIFGAYQEGALANYWTAAGNIASLLGIILVTHLEGGLVWLVVAFSGSTLLGNLVSATWLFTKHKPWLLPRIGAIRRDSLKKLGSVGGMFFVVQIAGILLFQTDNLIIARYLGADAVTPYSITWRLFNYTTLLQILTMPALWPAYAEAFARKDAVWIRKTFRINIITNTSVTLLLALPLVLFGTTIIRLWAGTEAVPPFSLLIWMGVWSIILVVMNSTACLLSSAGRLKGQMIYGMVTALLNITLSITLVQYFSITGVIAATVIAFLVCNVIPSFIEVRIVLKEPERYHQ